VRSSAFSEKTSVVAIFFKFLLRIHEVGCKYYGFKMQRLPLTMRLQSVAPPAPTPTDRDVDALAKFIQRHPRIVVLTGAGISTDSGIPDYRSPGRTPYKPIQHGQFITQHTLRQRYWARSYFGFPAFSQAQPNAVHLALAQWETQFRVGESSDPFAAGAHANVLPHHAPLLPRFRPHSPLDIFYSADSTHLLPAPVTLPSPPVPSQPPLTMRRQHVARGRINGIITQNVDSLHARAGMHLDSQGFLSLLIHSSLFSLSLPCNWLFPFVLDHFFQDHRRICRLNYMVRCEECVAWTTRATSN
jgi:hypothetical protein